MARRDRRSWGRREVERKVENKTKTFLALHVRGLSRAAIASTLGFSRGEVDQLLQVIEDHDGGSEAPAVAVGGGG